MKLASKRILKIGGPVLGVTLVGVVFVSISGAFIKIPTISIGGSSAVFPLISAFSNHYDQIDIVASAGGSSVGINSIVNGTKEIGMASKNPAIVDKDHNSHEYKAWKEKNVKTLTIAWDGIGIIYKPKRGTTSNLVINAETLAKIYTSFSGLKEITLGEVMNNEDKTIIIPYARNGGSSVSGTADAFYKDSKLKYKESEYWTKSLNKENHEFISKALSNGTYGSNVVQTAEANSQVWNRIKNGPEGSMTYLSSGFIINNKEAIEAAGFKVAYYGEYELTEANITNGYQWFRPFNLMYSINQLKNNEYVIKMFNWILFNEQAKEITRNEGYITLNEEQIKSMGWNGDNKNNDFLINKEFADWNLKHCGAQEQEK